MQQNYGPPEIYPTEISYNEKDFLGEGTYGKVYKGRCRGTSVAVKVPRMQRLTENEIKDFRSEVAIMSQIFHPNVVLFMGACTQPGNIQIVAEIMEADLDGFLHSSKAKDLSLYTRLKMARGAAKGMSWLHGINNIIHRDLKPANLLIDANYNVKVTDFGFSKLLKGKKTMKDSVKGTTIWMSPEVLKKEEFDKSTDVYGFGMILWELYTLKEPWEDDTDRDYQELVDAVIKGERPNIPQDCPILLKELIEACWHSDRQKRPPFPEVVSRLDHVIVDVVIQEPSGRSFWKKHFLEKKGELEEVVSWRDFSTVLQEVTGVSHFSFQMLSKFLVNHERKVTLETFNLAIHWFGDTFFQPNSEKVKRSLDRFQFLVKQIWFHGSIDEKEANSRLLVCENGSFLVRLSKTRKGFPYTLSMIFNKKPKHIRIQIIPCVTTQFIWKHGGSNVQLAGSFNKWKPVSMNYKSDGTWSVDVNMDLEVHQYKFIVNSEWRCDESKPIVDDGSGNRNNVIRPSGGNTGYLFSTPNHHTSYSSLAELLEGLKKDIGLTTPCPTPNPIISDADSGYIEK